MALDFIKQTRMWEKVFHLM